MVARVNKLPWQQDESLYLSYFKGKVHPKNMLASDARSDKIGKNVVDHFQYHIWFSRYLHSKWRNFLYGGSHFDMQMKVI